MESSYYLSFCLPLTASLFVATTSRPSELHVDVFVDAVGFRNLSGLLFVVLDYYCIPCFIYQNIATVLYNLVAKSAWMCRYIINSFSVSSQFSVNTKDPQLMRLYNPDTSRLALLARLSIPCVIFFVLFWCLLALF